MTRGKSHGVYVPLLWTSSCLRRWSGAFTSIPEPPKPISKEGKGSHPHEPKRMIDRPTLDLTGKSLGRGCHPHHLEIKVLTSTSALHSALHSSIGTMLLSRSPCKPLRNTERPIIERYAHSRCQLYGTVIPRHLGTHGLEHSSNLRYI